jgi:uncharacterized membrane protein YhaH (DUF805 family)
MMVILPLVYMVLYMGMFLFFLPKIIVKRAHDFGSNGKMEKNIFLGLYGVFFLIAILIVVQLFLMENEFIPLDFLLWGRKIVRYVIIFLGLYLLFRPWTKWKNEYWDDAANVKISFLG